MEIHPHLANILGFTNVCCGFTHFHLLIGRFKKPKFRLSLFSSWNILDYLGNLKLSEEIMIGTKLKLLTCTFIFKHKIYKSAYFEPCFLMSKFGEHFLDFQENHQTSTLKNRLLTLINAGPTYSEAKYKSLAFNLIPVMSVANCGNSVEFAFLMSSDIQFCWK